MKHLNDILNRCETLYDVLATYTGSKSGSDIIADLDAGDVIFSIASQNDLKYNDVIDFLNSHFNYPVECKVFQEHGPAGGWPVVEVICLDMVFYLDWVTD